MANFTTHELMFLSTGFTMPFELWQRFLESGYIRNVTERGENLFTAYVSKEGFEALHYANLPIPHISRVSGYGAISRFELIKKRQIDASMWGKTEIAEKVTSSSGWRLTCASGPSYASHDENERNLTWQKASRDQEIINALPGDLEYLITLVERLDPTGKLRAILGEDLGNGNP